MFNSNDGGTNKEIKIYNHGTITNSYYQTPPKSRNQVRNPFWFDVPDGIRSFWGRVEFLEKLHEILQQNKNKSVTILSQLKVLSGMGGIGKTQTARKYISQHEDFYENVIWIEAETQTTMTTSFLKLAGQLFQNPTERTNTTEKINQVSKALVENIYHQLCEGQRSTLFVFDNADDFDNGIDHFLPSNYYPQLKNLAILVTSRIQEWTRQFEKFHVISLDFFTPDESLMFILQQLEIPDSPAVRTETREFIQLMGGLPLALQQAVAFIREKQNETGSMYKFSNYIIDFKSAMPKILSDDQIPGSPSTIFATFTVTSEKVKTLKDGEVVIKIIEALAFLYADKIPGQFIRSIFSHLPEKLVHRSLVLLEKFSLIKRHSPRKADEDAFVSIHRQLQFVILQNLKISDTLESVFNKILEGCPGIFKNLEDESDEIFTNLDHLVENPISFIPTSEKFMDFIIVFADILFFFKGLAESHKMCKKLYNKFLVILGENHEKTVRLQKMEAVRRNFVFPSTLRQPEYLNMMENMLKRFTTIFGDEHWVTVNSKEKLAVVLDFQERYQESSRLYEQVLENRKKVLGESDSLTQSTRKDLSSAYLELQEGSKLLKLCQEIEQAEISLFGADYPDSPDIKFKKAKALFFLRKYDEASIIFYNLYEKKRLLGNKGQTTIEILQSLVKIEEMQGNFEKALELQRQVLELCTYNREKDSEMPITKKAKEDVDRLVQKLSSSWNFNVFVNTYENSIQI